MPRARLAGLTLVIAGTEGAAFEVSDAGWLVYLPGGRYRLAQLGIFDSVDLSYQTKNDHVRDVI